jgi:hypothetical protein
LLLVAPHEAQAEIAANLLAHAEEYLRHRGAATLNGGCLNQTSPFYLGLYGGSGSPGILTTDETQMQAFLSAGYEPRRRTVVYQRELSSFRPPIDRTVVQLRRQLQLDVTPDPLPDNWWDACTFGQIDRTHFALCPRSGGKPWGTAHFWDVEPLASNWGVHAVGLLALHADSEPHDLQQPNMLTFLLAESVRQLQSCGVTLVEVQAGEKDTLAGVCQRLGFHEVLGGVQFQKPV